MPQRLSGAGTETLSGHQSTLALNVIRKLDQKGRARSGRLPDLASCAVGVAR